VAALIVTSITARPVLAQTVSDPPSAACDDTAMAQDQSGCPTQVADEQGDEACDPTPGPDGLQHECSPEDTGSTTPGTAAGAQPKPNPEQPVKTERNPPGDIPDNQVFVTYTSPTGGYEFKAPEGWARSGTGMNISFSDKLNSIAVTVTSASVAPTAASVTAREAVALQQSGRAVEITSVKDVTLPAGPAVLLVYTLNSEPNPVTAKQYRLENTSFLLFNNGRLATLTLSSLKGSDNVDDWRLISRSFRWR
jgi:hypothetical protein